MPRRADPHAGTSHGLSPVATGIGPVATSLSPVSARIGHDVGQPHPKPQVNVARHAARGVGIIMRHAAPLEQDGRHAVLPQPPHDAVRLSVEPAVGLLHLPRAGHPLEQQRTGRPLLLRQPLDGRKKHGRHRLPAGFGIERPPRGAVGGGIQRRALPQRDVQQRPPVFHFLHNVLLFLPPSPVRPARSMHPASCRTLFRERDLAKVTKSRNFDG